MDSDGVLMEFVGAEVIEGLKEASWEGLLVGVPHERDNVLDDEREQLFEFSNVREWTDTDFDDERTNDLDEDTLDVMDTVALPLPDGVGDEVRDELLRTSVNENETDGDSEELFDMDRDSVPLASPDLVSAVFVREMLNDVEGDGVGVNDGLGTIDGVSVGTYVSVMITELDLLGDSLDIDALVVDVALLVASS
jgi:hypothetical protein